MAYRKGYGYLTPDILLPWPRTRRSTGSRRGIRTDGYITGAFSHLSDKTGHSQVVRAAVGQ